MAKNILDRIKNLNTQLETAEIIFLYRISAILITSLFFIIGEYPSSLSRKLFIIACISISGILINRLYLWNTNKTSIIVLLLLGETLFNSFILIPTGGLNSPYIWYSLNTILIASFLLKGRLLCWINLLIYLFCSTWVFYRVLSKDRAFSDVLHNESNIILCLILITCAIQLLTLYSHKICQSNLALQEKNHRISVANKKIKDSMNYIMELYQAVHLLTAQQEQKNLIKYLLEYTIKITKSNHVFYIEYAHDPDKISISSFSPKPIGNSMETWIRNEMSVLKKINSPEYYTIENSLYVLAPVKCQYNLHGFLGIQSSPERPEDFELVKFLSELGTIILEKFELERVNKDLLINEEQNRIANEIHDGVLQKLFSISCGLYGLKNRMGVLSHNKIENEILTLQRSINSAMSDLRSTIYGYSWKKRGVNNFVLDVNEYIDSVRYFHEIDAGFEIKGNHELMTVKQKKSFYRIICEGIGNAIHHGKAKHLSIKIDIGSNDIYLEIIDDGIGFDLSRTEASSNMGMGIKNINSLTCLLGGNMQLESNTGMGTKIKINVPIYQKFFEESVV